MHAGNGYVHYPQRTLREMAGVGFRVRPYVLERGTLALFTHLHPWNSCRRYILNIYVHQGACKCACMCLS